MKKIYIMDATYNGKILTELLLEKVEISGVIGLDNSIGKEMTSEYMDYSEMCREKGVKYIPVSSYSLKNEEDKEKLLKEDIDIIIIGSWQRLLPEWLISHCSIGVIGAHGSPEGITRGRGRSPQNWALILGYEDFEISIFWIDKEIDSGQIIDTKSFRLDPTDDILISYIKVNLLKYAMITENLENGKIYEHKGAVQTNEGRYLPKRTKEDGKIDWNRTCKEVYNMVRALTKPYPGAFTVFGEKSCTIWQAKPVDISIGYENAANGEVVDVIMDKILVKCGEGLLLIQEYSADAPVEKGIIFESADFKKQMEEIAERHTSAYDLPLSPIFLDKMK